MSLELWWLFLLTVFLLCGTPGPNMLHVMTRSIRYGPRRSIAAMAGCLSAIILGLVASAAGLGTLLSAAPQLFEALRWVGMGYLIYLGVNAWRGHDAPFDVGDTVTTSPLSSGAMFRGGLLIGMSNPKFLVFATAFFPQFIDPTKQQTMQFGVLILTFAACETFWYSVYGLGGQRLASRLSSARLRVALNRATGVLFVGFGLIIFGAKA